LPIEEFISIVQTEARAILNNRAVVEKLELRDLQAYLLGALNRFFAEKMRAKPLVQILMQDVSTAAQAVAQKNYQSSSERSVSTESKGQPSTSSGARTPNDLGSS
jgi:hypothetical protein